MTYEFISHFSEVLEYFSFHGQDELAQNSAVDVVLPDHERMLQRKE